MSERRLALTLLALMVAGLTAAIVGFTNGRIAGEAEAVAIQERFIADRSAVAGTAAARRTAGAGNFTAGQVKQVNGDIFEVSTANGVLNVKLTSETQITRSGTGTLSDLQPGERITVQGTRGADGVLTAESIQIGPSGPPGSAP